MGLLRRLVQSYCSSIEGRMFVGNCLQCTHHISILTHVFDTYTIRMDSIQQMNTKRSMASHLRPKPTMTRV